MKGLLFSPWLAVLLCAGRSTFTITAIPEPSAYVAALGLLAMMLWASPPPPARQSFLIIPPRRERPRARYHLRSPRA